MVITQESAQSLAGLNRPVAANVRTPREQQDIALPLGMEMFEYSLSARRRERSPKRITLDKHASFTDLTQRSA